MFSTDKNVKTIAEFVEALKDYVELQKELLQLNVVEIAVKLITLLILIIILSFIFLLGTLFLSVTIYEYLTETMSGIVASGIITLGYFCLFVLVILLRKPLIEYPFVKLLSSIFLEDKNVQK